MLSHTLRVGFSTPVLLTGGAERWIIDLARALCDRVMVSGINVFENKWPTHLQLKREIDQICPLFWGVDGLQELVSQSDVLIIWGLSNQWQFLGDCTIPIVLVSHGSGEWSRGATRGSERATRLVAVSQQAVTGFSYPEQQRVQVIENGVQLERIMPQLSAAQQRAAWGVGERPVLLQLGRISPEKNPKMLAHTVAALPPEWVGVYVGWGFEEQFVREVQEESRVVAPGRVFWPGLTADVGSAYHAADCMLLPSITEGLSLASLEALLAGLPVVCSRVGWFHQPENARFATVVPGELPSGIDFARGVLNGYGDRHRVRMAREHVYRHNTITVMAEQWHRLLLQLQWGAADDQHPVD